MTFPVPGNMSVQRQVRIINWIKIAQGILTISVFILGIARLATLTGRRSRSDSWIIGVSAKSLVVLLYEVLTERVPKFRRWGSLKAYSILNCIEFVFWMAATIITGMGLSRRCSGTSCVLGVIIILVTITLIVLAIPTAYIALSFFFHVRKHGSHPDPHHHDNEPFHLRTGSGSTSEVKGVERV